MSTLHSSVLHVPTPGRGTIDITHEIERVVQQSNVAAGLCQIFVHHTSASLIVCENADATVRADLERFMARLVTDGDPIFEHRAEGPDDMSAHIRSILTQTSIAVPVANGRCDLGTWQGIYLWEHRTGGHRRKITITVIGT